MIPKEWASYLALVMVVVQVLGRAWHAIKSGGGLVGIKNALLYGTNTPCVAPSAPQPLTPPAPAKVVPILLAALAGAMVLTACATSSNRSAYQAAGVVKVTAEAAMEGWAAWARAGKADADEIRAVEKAYRAYALAQNLVVDAGKATAGSADKTRLQVALQVAAACEADVVALVVKFLPPDLAAKLKEL